MGRSAFKDKIHDGLASQVLLTNANSVLIGKNQDDYFQLAAVDEGFLRRVHQADGEFHSKIIAGDGPIRLDEGTVVAGQVIRAGRIHRHEEHVTDDDLLLAPTRRSQQRGDACDEMSG